ncbi:MAG: alpha/beta fold hydrolase [Steroidobacteraceae bacterium]|nr:alpha/beta fold hydrolase [Nevskiaceae bacterium]MCP5471005.1 alpha/beta fold hydrolase [Nevskiaceae bacterium]
MSPVVLQGGALEPAAGSATVRRHYLDGRFGQMHLRMAGPPAKGANAKRPLLCFHLSPVSGAIYTGFLGEMGRDRFAVAPDTPGYGASDPPPEPPEIADYAAAMGEIMDGLGIAEADCVGFHTGSKIALELALQRPQAIRHLVLISTPVYTEQELAQMRADFAPLELHEDGSHLVDYWRALLNFRGPGQTLEMIMRYYPDHMRGGARRHWGHRAAFNYPYPPNLARATQPILVLNNNDDLQTFTPRAMPHIRNGRLVERPDWGHGFLDLHAGEFGRLVREFVDGDEGGNV